MVAMFFCWMLVPVALDASICAQPLLSLRDSFVAYSVLAPVCAPCYNHNHMNRAKRIVLLIVAVFTLGVAGSGLMVSSAYAGPAMQDSPCKAGDACESFIEHYINPFITLLTVVIGVVAAISLVVAGIQYSSAGSDPGKVQKAKDRIGQTLLGIMAYIFLFALLNYFVPGGFLR